MLNEQNKAEYRRWALHEEDVKEYASGDGFAEKIREYEKLKRKLKRRREDGMPMKYLQKTALEIADVAEDIADELIDAMYYICFQTGDECGGVLWRGADGRVYFEENRIGITEFDDFRDRLIGEEDHEWREDEFED